MAPVRAIPSEHGRFSVTAFQQAICVCKRGLKAAAPVCDVDEQFPRIIRCNSLQVNGLHLRNNGTDELPQKALSARGSALSARSLRAGCARRHASCPDPRAQSAPIAHFCSRLRFRGAYCVEQRLTTGHTTWIGHRRPTFQVGRGDLMYDFCRYATGSADLRRSAYPISV